MNNEDYKIAYENVMIANKMLEQENKQLKELCNKYEEEHKTTFETWLKDIEKIDKAIEYIKHAQNYGLGTVRNPYVKGEDLLEILGDKENE